MTDNAPLTVSSQKKPKNIDVPVKVWQVKNKATAAENNEVKLVTTIPEDTNPKKTRNVQKKKHPPAKKPKREVIVEEKAVVARKPTEADIENLTFILRTLKTTATKRRRSQMPRRHSKNPPNKLKFEWQAEGIQTVQAEHVIHMDRVDEIISLLSKSSTLYLDTEFVGEYSYHERLCLLQIAGDSGPAYLIDTIVLHAKTVVHKLLPLLQSTQIRKVLHNCREDLKILLHLLDNFEVEIPINNVIDTGIAFKFMGYKRTAFAEVVNHFLGINIPKDCQRSDWETALKEEQIHYAANDILYLRAIYPLLRQKLILEDKSIDKSLWVIKDTNDLLLSIVESFAQVQTTTKFSKRGRLPIPAAVLQEPSKRKLFGKLIHCREELARHCDLPRAAIIADATLKTSY